MNKVLNIYEIEEYAQDHGFDSCKFVAINKHGKIFQGQFIDAYYGMVEIPELGEGFIMLSNLRKELGNDCLEFIPVEFEG